MTTIRKQKRGIVKTTLQKYQKSFKQLVKNEDFSLQALREFGIKHNRYAFCCLALVGEKAISLPRQSCSGAWSLIPNSPITPSVVRIFTVPKMRFLSPDDVLLD